MKTRFYTLLWFFSVGDDQKFFEYLWMKKVIHPGGKKLFIPDEKTNLVSQKTFWLLKTVVWKQHFWTTWKPHEKAPSYKPNSAIFWWYFKRIFRLVQKHFIQSKNKGNFGTKWTRKILGQLKTFQVAKKILDYLKTFFHEREYYTFGQFL